MKKLTPKSYWDNNAYNAGTQGKHGLGISRFIPKSFHTVDINYVLRKYLKKDMTVLEVGVAPGINIIALANEFDIIPYGMDYSEKGVQQTKQNFKAAGYNPNNVYLGDLFDARFRAKHKGKYDVVSSWGLIEHFDNPAEVVRLHAEFLKPGGLLIIEVPNIRGVNEFFCRNIDELINHDLMSMEAMTKTFPKNVRIVYKDYCGGIINFGLYFSKNKFLEFIRLCVYGVQRFTLDQLERLLLLMRIRLTYKYTTPCMIVVGKKHGSR
jgi:2-polyprenyl-3-methyl-5-hydroxy-6-metoxy-1,4-benzoquinol methylase